LYHHLLSSGDIKDIATAAVKLVKVNHKIRSNIKEKLLQETLKNLWGNDTFELDEPYFRGKQVRENADRKRRERVFIKTAVKPASRATAPSPRKNLRRGGS
jgi:hypothetical protein